MVFDPDSREADLSDPAWGFELATGVYDFRYFAVRSEGGFRVAV